MKHITKSLPPRELNDYFESFPDATWDQMRDDNSQGGYAAAHACRNRAILDQKGLCAYCEQKISSADPLHSRVEHFHKKSDRSGEHNWDLDWENMLAVCDGGNRTEKGERQVFPLPANLSCDAHKDHMSNIGKLPVDCEGHLLNPLDSPAFPNVFALEKDTGVLKADVDVCDTVEIPGYEQISTVELVRQTIAVLNLNCDRLLEKRLLLIRNINRNKKELRKRNIHPSDASVKLAQRYFQAQWPEFFTTIRCFLGSTAEDYLNHINYHG